MVERKTDVALISDYNRQLGDDQHWVSSLDGKYAVTSHRNSDCRFMEQGSGIGLAWARTGRTLFYCILILYIYFFFQNLITPQLVISTEVSPRNTPYYKYLFDEFYKLQNVETLVTIF